MTSSVPYAPIPARSAESNLKFFYQFDPFFYLGKLSLKLSTHQEMRQPRLLTPTGWPPLLST
jgi:hypothetical protein